MIFLALPGPTEMWVVLIIIVVLFGGAKLPALARAMGASINQFKRGLREEAEKTGQLNQSRVARTAWEPD